MVAWPFGESVTTPHRCQYLSGLEQCPENLCMLYISIQSVVLSLLYAGFIVPGIKREDMGVTWLTTSPRYPSKIPTSHLHEFILCWFEGLCYGVRNASTHKYNHSTDEVFSLIYPSYIAIFPNFVFISNITYILNSLPPLSLFWHGLSVVPMLVLNSCDQAIILHELP